MASIRQRDGKYQVRIVRKGHRGLTRTFNNRTDAIKWARQTEVEIERGAIQTHTRSITLCEAISRYLRECTPRKKSARAEKYLLQTWASSDISPLELGRIRPAQIAAWRDTRLSSGAATQTVRNGLTALSAVYEQAIREWGFDSLTNPVRRIRRPGAPNSRSRRVSADETQTLSRLTESRLLPSLITLAVETGMRLSELTSARWAHLDLTKRTLHLPDTKNGESRTVPLSTAAVTTLTNLRHRVNEPNSGRVFNITPHAATVAFRRAVKRARKAYLESLGDQQDKGLFSNLRFHDLRHEAVSRLFERGLNVIEVSSISGHKTLQMLKRYTHLRAADLAKRLE
jgi:integrase